MPKLRFPGFEGEWENTELGNLAIYGKDKTRVTKNHFVSTENIEQNFGGIVPFEDSKTMVDGTEFTKGDILIANIRPYLKKIWQSDMDGACNADVLVLKPQEIDNVFFYFLVAQNKFIDYVMGGVKGSKMPRGDKAHILQYNTAVPSILEQQQIAKFLSLLSNRIATQKELVETLKKYKRGVIKSLFERKRIISCKESQWKKCYMGDVITLQSGQDFVPSDYNDNGTGIPYMTGASCIVDDKTVVSRWTTKPRCMAYKDDTLLVCKGSGSGAVVKLTQKEAHIARQFMALQCNSAITKDFCFYLTLYLSNRIKQAATGLIEGIDRKTVLNQEIMLPSIDEQNKIANFLSNYDNIIYAHKTYLAYINEIKKHLLQQLFI